jgi:cell division protein FtsW
LRHCESGPSALTSKLKASNGVKHYKTMIKTHYDRTLLGITAVLVLFGFFMLASASLGPTASKAAFFYDTLSRQILIGFAVGGTLLFITSRIPYQKWQKIALPLFLASFFITLLVFEPHIGVYHGGAKRWINFGAFFFQPSELLKFGFIVYLSSWLTSRKNDISSFKFGLFPFLIIVAFVAVILILEPNIGTLAVIGITAVSLFFIAGGRFKQIAVMILIAAILFAILVQIKPHLKERLMVFTNPSHDPQGAGYQLKQAKIAFGSGGLFGKGFGMSVQKFNFLPEPIGDSIFAIIGEEFGFLGTVVLICLFMLFLYRGLFIVSQAPDDFGKLLGSGIVILIISQCFLNMAAMTGILPLAGLPLLFISQGGSALALVLAEVGVLLNISKYRFNKG